MKTNRISNCIIYISFLCFCLTISNIGTVNAQEKSQTSSSKIVVVLPFQNNTTNKDAEEDILETVIREFEKHNFVVVDKEKVKSYLEQEKIDVDMEEVDKDTAAKIGKALGANIIVTGAILEYESYTKTTFFGSKRKGKVGLRTKIFDIDKEEWIYKKQESRTTSQKEWQIEKSKRVRRRASANTVNTLYEEFFKKIIKKSQ